MNSRRSWIVLGVGVFAYIVAIMQRTTIGVAGVEAADRFHVDASMLSALAVVQVIVYAGMQIPVGALIDRLGPRRLILSGTILMALGQFAVAFAPGIGTAIGGRVLVGAGDAMVFTAAIRLVNSWFSGRILPQLSQWVGNLGQLGQVLSAVPFALLLHATGWSVAFASAASLSVLAIVAVLAALRDRPSGAAEGPRPIGIAGTVQYVRRALSRPGTQLGFWSHFVTQSSGTVFTLMWGVPFLVFGLGYSPTFASGLLIVFVGAGMVSGPVLGILSGRFPWRRSNIVLAVVVALGVAWGVVLLWPGTPPLWLIVALLIVIGVGGPGSLIGFDFARTFNPLHTLGSANGIVNVGGFTASFVMMFLIGLLLDLQKAWGLVPAGELYSLDAFRWAFAVQYLVVGAGVVFLVRARRRTRRRLSEEEGINVGPIWVAYLRRRRARAARSHQLD